MNALSPAADADAAASGVFNVEAEQGLLGAVLYDNAVLERVSESLAAEHFYEPLHGRMYEALALMIRQGRGIDPLAIAERFKHDPAFVELGGFPYLADLVDHAPPAAVAQDYAGVILDLALRRRIVAIGGDIAKAADQDRETTAREHIEQAEAQLYDLAERGSASKGFVSFSDTMVGSLELVTAAFERDGGLSGVSTGLVDLDRKLGGLHGSDLLILAGRPSMGKTALATNIAFNVARRYKYDDNSGSRKTTDGGVVGFFSLEMSGEQLGLRIVADVSGVSGDKMRKGEIDAAEYARIRDAIIEIQAAPLHIDATGGLTIDKLAARARRLKRQCGLDLIVVDYLQLASAPGRRGEGRVQEVTEITMGLKAMAKDLDVPVLALSQLSRQVEQRDDKRPQLSDLRESGSIEQDADCVMFVYRESYYLERAEPKPDSIEHHSWIDQMNACRGVAEVIIGKNRHGPIGTVRLAFDADTTRFGNLAREEFGAGRTNFGYADD
jgi:replicative DNA helicase